MKTDKFKLQIDDSRWDNSESAYLKITYPNNKSIIIEKRKIQFNSDVAPEEKEILRSILNGQVYFSKEEMQFLLNLSNI